MRPSQRQSRTIIRKYLAPAEGEVNIRTYYCTRLSSNLFGLRADGFLSVTNKRVIFYGIGSSLSGKSTLQSEIPISEVSGITAYKGTYFSFGAAFLVLLFSFLLGGVTFGMVSGILKTMVTSFIDNFDMDALQTSLIALQIVLFLLGGFFFVVAYFIKREKIWKSAVAYVGVTLFTIISVSYSLFEKTFLGGFFWGGYGDSFGIFKAISSVSGIFVLLGWGYFLRCIYLYAQRETLTLAIGAKGGSSTPITIAGVSNLGLYNVAALRSLTSQPTQEAAQMLQELGAMIMDIQALGDMAIKKWKYSD